jgi:hypothetical protein
MVQAWSDMVGTVLDMAPPVCVGRGCMPPGCRAPNDPSCPPRVDRPDMSLPPIGRGCIGAPCMGSTYCKPELACIDAICRVPKNCGGWNDPCPNVGLTCFGDHCAGAVGQACDDCSRPCEGSQCSGGICASPVRDMSPPPVVLGCIGASCVVSSQCKPELACVDGFCMTRTCSASNDQCSPIGLTCVNRRCYGDKGQTCDACSRPCWMGICDNGKCSY